MLREAGYVSCLPQGVAVNIPEMASSHTTAP